MMVSGTVAAIVGAPVAGVGAAPGLGLAGTGGAVKTIGDGIEIATNFLSGDTKSGAEGVAGSAVDYVIDKGLDAVIPGPTPKMSKEIRESAQNTKDIIKNTIESEKIVKEKIKK